MYVYMCVGACMCEYMYVCRYVLVGMEVNAYVLSLLMTQGTKIVWDLAN